jgi:hypothetical protein
MMSPFSPSLARTKEATMAVVTSPPTVERSAGRKFFWGGIVLTLLGLGLAVVQYSLKQLMLPWYAPILTTAAAGLLLLSLTQRRTVARIIGFLLIAALAVFEWFFLVSLSKVPPYVGPAQPGQRIPAFHTTLADGSSFTDKDLVGKKPRILVFFRGRW